jgi:hypothetical protein
MSSPEPSVNFLQTARRRNPKENQLFPASYRFGIGVELTVFENSARWVASRQSHSVVKRKLGGCMLGGRAVDGGGWKFEQNVIFCHL